MRITIAAVGRLKAGAERELFERYRSRLDAVGKQIGVGPLEEIELLESGRGSSSERRAEEAAALLKKIPDGAVLIALDETGKPRTSQEFAKHLETVRDRGVREIVFAIGGAEGHGSALTDRADSLLSLGPMTLPHRLARVVLAEQLYRAATILTGHPYHKG